MALLSGYGVSAMPLLLLQMDKWHVLNVQGMGSNYSLHRQRLHKMVVVLRACNRL